MLQEFIRANRADIIKRCRDKVARRSMPLPTTAEIDHGVPLFLDQLVEALAKGGKSTRPSPGADSCTGTTFVHSGSPYRRWYARNADNGCVFTVDLPRLAAMVLATA